MCKPEHDLVDTYLYVKWDKGHECKVLDKLAQCCVELTKVSVHIAVKCSLQV